MPNFACAWLNAPVTLNLHGHANLVFVEPFTCVYGATASETFYSH